MTKPEPLLPDDPGIRPPLQARSQRTMQRMVEAALELIGEGGLGAASVHAIVHRAEASVGSFYARFESRDDLLAHLRGQVWGRAGERWTTAVRERGGEDSLGLQAEVVWACRVLLTLLVEDPVRRAFLLEDAEARDLEADLQAEIRGDLVHLLQRHREEMGHPDPDFAVEFGLRLILGGAREMLAAEPDESGGVSERAQEELARVFGDYLRGGAGGSPGQAELPVSDQIDPFDVWG